MLMVPLAILCVSVYEIFIDAEKTAQNKDCAKTAVPSWKEMTAGRRSLLYVLFVVN